MRLSPLRVFAVIALAVLLSGCVTTGAPVSAYDRAAIGYVEASIAYDAALDLAVTLRSQRLISDDGWQVVDSVQHKIADAQPIARSLLNIWKVSGQKPSSWDATFAAILTEIAKLQEITR